MSGTISLLPLRVNSRNTNSIIAHENVPFLILNLENSKSFVVCLGRREFVCSQYFQ